MHYEQTKRNKNTILINPKNQKMEINITFELPLRRTGWFLITKAKLKRLFETDFTNISLLYRKYYISEHECTKEFDDCILLKSNLHDI